MCKVVHSLGARAQNYTDIYIYVNIHAIRLEAIPSRLEAIATRLVSSCSLEKPSKYRACGPPMIPMGVCRKPARQLVFVLVQPRFTEVPLPLRISVSGDNPSTVHSIALIAQWPNIWRNVSNRFSRCLLFDSVSRYCKNIMAGLIL